jgi:hypothetical protein
MKIDELSLEELKTLCKKFMIRVKKSIKNENGYEFKAGEYYFGDQDGYGVMLWSDDRQEAIYISYPKAIECLYSDE